MVDPCSGPLLHGLRPTFPSLCSHSSLSQAAAVMVPYSFPLHLISSHLKLRQDAKKAGNPFLLGQLPELSHPHASPLGRREGSSTCRTGSGSQVQCTGF